MKHTPIYSRVLPQSLRAHETYKYKIDADITGKLRVLQTEAPAGSVEIIFSYSSPVSFNDEAIQDIRQHKDLWKTQGEQSARVGYLGLSNYQEPNLVSEPELARTRGVLPLDVQIKNAQLSQESKLMDGSTECRIVQAYLPGFPRSCPFRLDFEVVDEDDNSAEQRFEGVFGALQEVKYVVDGKLLKERLGLPPEADLDQETKKWQKARLQEVRDELSQRIYISEANFEPTLTLRLTVELLLPAEIAKRLVGDGKPTLAEMTLKWPVPTPTLDDRLKLESVHWFELVDETSQETGILFYENDPEHLTYELECGVIKWGNIGFDELPEKPGDPKGSKSLVCYLELTVDRPGELYGLGQLEGQLQITLPALLSGLGIDYFGADGKKAIPQDAKMSSVLAADFVLNVEDRFFQKTFAPYQCIQFDGVVLDDMRIENIQTLLSDLGFRGIEKDNLSDQKAGNETTRWFINAKQRKGLASLELTLLAEGTKTVTHRQKGVAGGPIYTTDVETGHTTIHLYGLQRGENKDLQAIMQQVRKQLKQQFRHVRAND